MRRRIVVALTGASGAVYGIRALQALHEQANVEVHLVLSAGARATIAAETDYDLGELRKLADVVHPIGNVGASIASGSFLTHGMLVAPCSIKTLSGIANSFADNLITRAADVALKERRPLVLLVRETPLHHGHLRLMMQAAESGAVLMPPVPAFYHRPQTIDDIVSQTVGRALDQLHLESPAVARWAGLAETFRGSPDTTTREA